MNSELEALMLYYNANPSQLNDINAQVRLNTLLTSIGINNIDYILSVKLFGATGKNELSLSLQSSDEALEYGRDWIDFALLHIRTGLDVSFIRNMFNVGIKEHQLYALCESNKYTDIYKTSMYYKFGSKGKGRKQKVISFNCKDETLDAGISLFGVTGFSSLGIEGALRDLCFSSFDFKRKPSTDMKLRDYSYSRDNTDSVSSFITRYAETYKLMRIFGASRDIAVAQLERILTGDIGEGQYIYFEDITNKSAYTFLNYKELCALLDVRLNLESNNSSQYIRKNFIFRYIADEYVRVLSSNNDNEFLVSWSYWLSLRFSPNVNYYFNNGVLITSLRDDCLPDYGIIKAIGFVGVSSREVSDLTKIKTKFEINSFAFATSYKLNSAV